METMQRQFIEANLKNIRGITTSPRARYIPGFHTSRTAFVRQRIAGEKLGVIVNDRLIDTLLGPFPVIETKSGQRKTLPLRIQGRLTPADIRKAVKAAGLTIQATTPTSFLVKNPRSSRFEIEVKLSTQSEIAEEARLRRDPNLGKSNQDEPEPSKAVYIHHNIGKGALADTHREQILRFVQAIDRVARPTIKTTRTNN